MAKSLTFLIDGKAFETSISKIDRDKLYGRVVKKVLDDGDAECYAGHISSDGLHIFGKTSFEMGYIDKEGQWLERKQLKVIDEDNHVYPNIPSSFDEQIEVTKTISTDDYLMMSTKSVYHLVDASEAFIDLVLQSTDLFCFSFNYRASHHPDTAVLIANDSGLFMVLCQQNTFEWVGADKHHATLIVNEDQDDDDEFDFAMM